jgi:hypothetical protein
MLRGHIPNLTCPRCGHPAPGATHGLVRCASCALSFDVEAGVRAAARPATLSRAGLDLDEAHGEELRDGRLRVCVAPNINGMAVLGVVVAIGMLAGSLWFAQIGFLPFTIMAALGGLLGLFLGYEMIAVLVNRTWIEVAGDRAAIRMGPLWNRRARSVRGLQEIVLTTGGVPRSVRFYVLRLVGDEAPRSVVDLIHVEDAPLRRAARLIVHYRANLGAPLAFSDDTTAGTQE